MDRFPTSSIPVMRSPADLMSLGPNSDNLAAAAVQAHPIDRMQRSQQVSSGGSSNALDLDAIRRLYGSALAMRLSTERRLASQVGGRLPGMDANPDSMAMLDALTGDDFTLDFRDFLNVSKTRPESTISKGSNGPHFAMEARLGL